MIAPLFLNLVCAGCAGWWLLWLHSIKLAFDVVHFVPDLNDSIDALVTNVRVRASRIKCAVKRSNARICGHDEIHFGIRLLDLDDRKDEIVA